MYDDITNSCSSRKQDIAAFQAQQIACQEFQDCPRDLPVLWGRGAQCTFHCYTSPLKNKLNLF